MVLKKQFSEAEKYDFIDCLTNELIPRAQRFFYNQTRQFDLTADLSQDLCVKLFSALNNGSYDAFYLRKKVGAKAWVFFSARNILADHHRKENASYRPQKVDSAEYDEVLNNLKSMFNMPDSFEPKAQDILIQAAIEGIEKVTNPDKREIMRLRYLEYPDKLMPYKEIVERTGIPMRAVNNCLNLTPKHIREALPDNYSAQVRRLYW